MKVLVDVGVGKAVERWLASQDLDVVALYAAFSTGFRHRA